MHNQLNNLKNEALKIRLTSAERARMRAAIFGVEQPMVSPYTTYHFHWFSVRFAMPVAALLVVVLGAGTVYAAEGSLPGDTLYTVKVNVAEPVREALALSPTAKAEFHAKAAATRLEEAESLAAQGRLTASTTVALEENLNRHVAAARSITDTLDKENPGAAEGVTTTLDSSLSAHSAILDEIGGESSDSDTRKHSARLAFTARAERNNRGEDQERSVATMAVTAAADSAPVVQTLSVAAEPASTQEVVEASDKQEIAQAEPVEEPRANRAAERLKERATSQLEDLQKQVDKLREGFSSSTKKQVEGRLTEIQSLIEDGNNTEALRAGVELSAFVKASEKFDKNILERLIQSGDDEHRGNNNSGRDNEDD